MTAEIDSHGNLARRYSYRADGKMTLFESAALDHDGVEDHNHFISRAEYFYDALGRRVAKKMSKFNIDHDHWKDDPDSFVQSFSYLGEQDKILLGKAGDGATTLYIDGQGIDEHLGQSRAKESKLYLVDHLGSVLNGEAAGERHMYGPFGEQLDREDIGINPRSDPAQY